MVSPHLPSRFSVVTIGRRLIGVGRAFSVAEHLPIASHGDASQSTEMPKPSRRLSRAVIVRALSRLGELCTEKNSRVEIAIYGGRVMMLAYDCRETTKDIDAIFHPPEVVEPLIRQVAREQKRPKIG